MRVDHADPAQQPQVGIALLGHRRGRRLGHRIALQQRERLLGLGRRQHALARRRAGFGHQRRRGAVALAQARAAQPREAAAILVFGPETLLQ